MGRNGDTEGEQEKEMSAVVSHDQANLRPTSTHQAGKRNVRGRS